MNAEKLNQISALYKEFADFVKSIPSIKLIRLSDGYETQDEINPHNIVNQLKEQGREDERIFSLYCVLFYDDYVLLDIDLECGFEMNLRIKIDKLKNCL